MSDAFVIYEQQEVILNEGDIVIRSAASFSEIMTVLVDHAKDFLEGDYTTSKILDELFRTRFKNDKLFTTDKE